MSAHGISPAWTQRNEFGRGEPWIFEPTAILSIFLNCNIDLTADFSVLITNLSLTCNIASDNSFSEDITTLSLDCLIEADQFDILGTMIISLSCFVEVV